MEELRNIMEKFAASGWGLISIPAHAWLKGESNKDTLIASIKQADRECGSCGCKHLKCECKMEIWTIYGV